MTITSTATGYALRNDLGTFLVNSGFSLIGHRIVGPGYVNRLTLTNGKQVCSGSIEPGLSLNDPRIQGLGIAGWHHYRDLPGVTNIWDRGWDFGGHKQAGADPFGVSHVEHSMAGNQLHVRVDFVDRYSAAESKRVMSVSYDYTLLAKTLKCVTTFHEFPDGLNSGPSAYLKEPKLALGVGGSNFIPEVVTVLDKSGKTLRSLVVADEPKLRDPRKGTIQIGFDTRSALRFAGSGSSFTVTLGLWENGATGLDGWAVDANTRKALDPTACAAYCLQGPNRTLTRQWEVAKSKLDPRLEVMLHGWEGGYGLPDCLCAARAFSPGKTWTNTLTFSS